MRYFALLELLLCWNSTSFPWSMDSLRWGCFDLCKKGLSTALITPLCQGAADFVCRGSTYITASSTVCAAVQLRIMRVMGTRQVACCTQPGDAIMHPTQQLAAGSSCQGAGRMRSVLKRPRAHEKHPRLICECRHVLLGGTLRCSRDCTLRFASTGSFRGSELGKSCSAYRAACLPGLVPPAES